MITEESLLVIRGLGIQTTSSPATYLSKAATRFIPTTQVQDIVIHEAFKGFEVRFYLAALVEGEPNAVVVFPVSWQECGRQLLTGYRMSANICPRRNYCQGELYWKRSGEVHATVCVRQILEILFHSTMPQDICMYVHGQAFTYL